MPEKQITFKYVLIIFAVVVFSIFILSLGWALSGFFGWFLSGVGFIVMVPSLILFVVMLFEYINKTFFWYK